LIEWPEDPPGEADRLAAGLEAQGFDVIIRRIVTPIFQQGTPSQ
jgi:hypothetical protein